MRAVGITNQRETVVVWDRKTGKPVCNAIVWQDMRTEDACRDLAAQGGIGRFQALTGLPVATYFSGPKLAWILENVAGARDRAARGELLAGTIDAWLVWNLSGGPDGGVHATDVTNASRTLCMDLRAAALERFPARALRDPGAMLPAIAASSDPTTFGAIRMPGPYDGVPITGVLGDQQAALVGQGCLEKSEAKSTYGTGCFLLLNTGTEPVLSKHGLLTTVAYRFGREPARYALEGSVAVAGALVQWLRDNLGIIAKASDDRGARGERARQRRRLLRAGVLRSVRAALAVRRARRDRRPHAVRDEGASRARGARGDRVSDARGARGDGAGLRLPPRGAQGRRRHGASTISLMQFQADQLGVPVIRPAITETTALGAAYAAGLAIGFWTEAEIRTHWQGGPAVAPARPIRPLARRLYRGWKKAVERSLGWVG